MAQQPNIELDPEDLPRAVPTPDPPRRWTPSMRPGMITSPAQMPRKGKFGTPGPDTGWALKLINAADLPDRGDELVGVLTALVSARASHFGRAPIPEDLEVAMVLCGIGEDLPDSVVEQGRRWVAAAAHERSKGRTAVAEVDRHLLAETPDRIRWALSRNDSTES